MSDKYEPLRRILDYTDRKVNNQRWIATGIVKKVRKADRKVKVMILPEQVESNWLRLYALNAGENFVSAVLPEVDSEVIMLFVGANPNHAVVLMGNILQPGDQVPSVEGDNDWMIGDKYGNKIIMQDGKVKILSDSIELGEDATNAIVNETILPYLDNHTHQDPLSGTTGIPVIPTNAGHKTTVTKAK